MHAKTADGVADTHDDALPIFTKECHHWSDGEDEHDEDHNSYYDLCFLFIVKDPTCIITYSWNAASTYEHGMIDKWTDPLHLKELQDDFPTTGYMSRTTLKRLVLKEVGWHEQRKLYCQTHVIPSECLRAAQAIDSF